jgi:uncharacterized protein involved in exopolysaccharide biosynthesis
MEPGIPILRLVNAVLRRRHIIARVVICTILIIVLPAIAKPRTYSSDAIFVPQAKRISAAAGLAAQFGISGFPQSDPSESPAFYGDLLQSRSILEDAVRSSYVYTRAGKPSTATYGVIHEIEGPTPAKREEAAIKLLRSRINVT